MNPPPIVAALFVDPRGPYASLEGVDPWPAERDARTYSGPHPVVVHPPCERWGRYARGGPSARRTYLLGDDDGCFASGLDSVRRWGGVLEHPEGSHAWDRFGIKRPWGDATGWRTADALGGFTCRVDQGHYGHPARKATWLYVYGVPQALLPDLRWDRFTGGRRLDAGFHSAEERAFAVASGLAPTRDRGRLTKSERIHTPVPFRDILLAIARSARPRA